MGVKKSAALERQINQLKQQLKLKEALLREAKKQEAAQERLKARQQQQALKARQKAKQQKQLKLRKLREQKRRRLKKQKVEEFKRKKKKQEEFKRKKQREGKGAFDKPLREPKKPIHGPQTEVERESWGEWVEKFLRKREERKLAKLRACGLTRCQELTGVIWEDGAGEGKVDEKGGAIDLAKIKKIGEVLCCLHYRRGIEVDTFKQMIPSLMKLADSIGYQRNDWDPESAITSSPPGVNEVIQSIGPCVLRLDPISYEAPDIAEAIRNLVSYLMHLPPHKRGGLMRSIKCRVKKQDTLYGGHAY